MSNNCILLPGGSDGLPADPLFNQLSFLWRARDGYIDLKGATTFDTKTAPLDPTYSKHGAVSALFDGTSAKSLIASAGNAGVVTDTGWTIDAWIYIAGGSTARAIASSQLSSSAANSFLLYINAAGKLVLGTNIDRAVSSASVPTNQWCHVAVAKSGADYCTLWINGQFETLPGGFGGNFTATGIGIGSRKTAGVLPFNGAIDSVRITKAIRYAGAFVPTEFSDH